ncbi:hypothetical protein BsWGS_24817 [Bradybaena similaris]
MNAAYLFLLFAVHLASFAAQSAVVSRQAPKCQPGWERFGDSCYAFSRDRWWFPWSWSWCRAFGGNLLEINSYDEFAWIVKELGRRRFHHTWLGASDMFTEGTFRWMTNYEPVDKVSFFLPGQPNNIDGVEHCLAMAGDGGYYWADDECWHKMRFVCEKRML